MQEKSVWLSKTLWTNLIMAVMAFIPVAGEWLQTNPEVLVGMFTVVNLILRLVTKDRLLLY